MRFGPNKNSPYFGPTLSSKSLSAILISTGSFIPGFRESNHELENELGLEKGWIRQRTGVNFRAIADAEDAVSDLAVRAGGKALNDSNAPNVSVLILATSTPDHMLPPTSAEVATRLGLHNVAAFDVTVACSGFLYALILADSLVQSSNVSVLVIAANILSRRCVKNDPKTRPIFADGAGAVIVGPASSPYPPMQFAWESDGTKSSSLLIPDGGSRTPFNFDTLPASRHLMHLNDGNAVFRYAVEKMAELGARVIADAGLTETDIDWWIPHQANTRIIDATRRILKIREDKTLLTLPQFGNSSAATIPVTLDYYLREDPKLNAGDKVLLTAAAAGMTSAAALVTLPEQMLTKSNST